MKRIIILFILFWCCWNSAMAQCKDNVVMLFVTLVDGATPARPLVIPDQDLADYTATITFGSETAVVPGDPKASFINLNIPGVGIAPMLKVDLQRFSALIELNAPIDITIVTNEGIRFTFSVPRSKCGGTIQYPLNATPPVVQPSISLSDAAICAGEDTEVTVTNPPANWTGSGYSLSVTPPTGGVTVSALEASPIKVTAAAGATATSYKVQLIKDSKVVSEASLTVGAPPKITITPNNVDGATGYYCTGGSDKTTVTLSAASNPTGYTFKWTKPGGGTQVGGSLTGVNTAGTYTVNATKSDGCPATASIVVNEKTAPAKPSIQAPSPDHVCVDDKGKTTLKVNSPTSGSIYAWSTGATNASLDVAHNTVGTNAGGATYNVKESDGKCTSHPSTDVTLYGHQITLALNPNTSVQVPSGSPQTVTATATLKPTSGAVDPNTWSWTGTGDGIKTGNTTNKITTNPITQSSSYYAEVKDQYGCAAKSPTITFTVKAGTVWDITLAAKSGCFGSTINLTATITGTVPSPTYAWTSSDGLTFASANALSTNVSAANPGAYRAKLTVTDANNVVKYKEVVVTIFANPTLENVKVASTDVCKGDQVTLEAVNPAAASPEFGTPGTLSYIWGGATATPGNNATATATLAAGNNTYTLKVKDGNNCESAQKSITYVGHEVNVTNISLNPASPVPYGSTASLSCVTQCNPATGSVVSYEWTPVAGIDGLTNQATATTTKLTAAGSYTLKVTDDNGCEGTKSINFTINGQQLTVSTQPAYICAGATTTLSAVESGGTGTATYEWISVDGRLTFDNAFSANPKVTTTTPGDYPVKVKVTKGVQTAESAEVTITIGAQPVLTGIAIHMAGDPAVISGSVLPGTVVEAIVAATNLPAGTIYNWTSTPPDLIADISGDQLTATSVKLEKGAPCFKLQVTNAQGKCLDEEEACMTVAGTALDVTMTDVTVCAGASPVISSVGKVTGGVPSYQYTWSCTNPAFHYTVSADGVSITVTPNTAVGTYPVSLKVTDKKGNVASKNFDVTVDAVPKFVAVSTTPQTVKVGNKVTLSASVTPIASTVTWLPGNPQEGSQQGTTGTASIVAGTFNTVATYTYTVEAANGTCRKDTTVIINVIEKTEEIVIDAKDVQVCENVGGTLKADVKGGGTGGLSYRWEVISGNIVLESTTGSSVNFTSADPGTHRVKVYVTDKSADPAPPQEKIITVTVHSNPVIDPIVVTNVATNATGTTVERGDELKLTTSANPNSAILTWTESGSGNSLLSTTGSPVFTIPMTDTKTYTVTATANGTCTASREVTVTVKPTTGALLELELEKKCADSGESMVLSMKATGGTTYSFTLKNSEGLTKTFDGRGPWQHLIALADEGTYFVHDFKAFNNTVEINPTKVVPAQIAALFYVTPSITITNGNVQTVCQGDALTLSASSQPAGTTYNWSSGIANGETFYPKKSMVDTVTVISAEGCIAKASVSITMIPKPTVTIGASPETICLGDTVVLTAGGSATEFVWNNGQKGSPITVVPNVGGTIRYVVTGKEMLNGCTDTATVKVVVNEPPKITSASKAVRSIAIGKSVAFGVKASGKGLSYEWQRWTGSSWMTLYDASDDQPAVSGSHSDSLKLINVPKSWDGTKLQCVVTNSCGVADTTFTLNVKECFDILDVEWDMCHGIRPEKDPSVAIDGWYCPGSRIAICARLVLDDPDVDLENAVYKWTVDGLSTTDGRWGEMKFISDSSILSWIPPVEWQDNITIALCAYVDGACDTICKSYLRLKAMKYTDLAWEMKTSVDPTRMFCPGDTVTCWINDPGKTAGLNPTYKWYNDIFDLEVESPTHNKVVSLENDRVVMAMGQQDSWMKVIMTPSPEICTREPHYTDTAFLQVKKFVKPSLYIDCADTIACRGDSVRMSAIYANAGLNPTFQWQRSVGDPFPDWNLGTKSHATVYLDEKDVWVKCVMKPSADVCYDKTKPIVDAIQIKVLQAEGSIQIACDMKDKEPGDELVFTSEVKDVLGDHKYEWMVNGRLAPEGDSEYSCSTLSSGDVVYCLVSGERLCQSRIQSNEIKVEFGRVTRDTMITIYRNERVQNLKLFKAGDEGKLFLIDKFPHDGIALLTLLGGQFNYVPNRNFVGVDYVHYLVKDKFNPNKVEEGHIYINVKENGLDNLPNVITPNGDGLNDEWHLETITEKYTDYEITIYNRTGSVVFRCRNNYVNDWNGQTMSNPNYEMPLGILQSGIYTYVISIDKGQKKIISWLEIRAGLSRSSYR